jgi:hypothetical protein
MIAVTEEKGATLYVDEGSCQNKRMWSAFTALVYISRTVKDRLG